MFDQRVCTFLVSQWKFYERCPHSLRTTGTAEPPSPDVFMTAGIWCLLIRILMTCIISLRKLSHNTRLVSTVRFSSELQGREMVSGDYKQDGDSHRALRRSLCGRWCSFKSPKCTKGPGFTLPGGPLAICLGNRLQIFCLILTLLYCKYPCVLTVGHNSYRIVVVLTVGI